MPPHDHRLRIEHAQILAGQDVTRFARLGVLPSMQATHWASVTASVSGGRAQADGSGSKPRKRSGTRTPGCRDFRIGDVPFDARYGLIVTRIRQAAGETHDQRAEEPGRPVHSWSTTIPATVSSAPRAVVTDRRSPRKITPSGIAKSGAVADRTEPTATPAYFRLATNS